LEKYVCPISQPWDPIMYSSLLFEKMLHIRNETGHDPVQDGVHIEDRYYNNHSFTKVSLKLKCVQCSVC
jgi:hypothetical protein